jgi:hypothetical protein
MVPLDLLYSHSQHCIMVNKNELEVRGVRYTVAVVAVVAAVVAAVVLGAAVAGAACSTAALHYGFALIIIHLSCINVFGIHACMCAGADVQ